MIFRDKEKLSPRYLPSKLVHREKELKLLRAMTSDLAIGEKFLRVIQVQGPAGMGKTSAVHMVGRDLERVNKKYGFNFKYIYINLKLEAPSKFVLFNNIAGKVDPVLRSRNLTAEELLHEILEYLRKKDIRVVLALDEIDYFLRFSRDSSIIYDLTRFSELKLGEPVNIVGLITIARDPSWRKILTSGERSSLGRLIVNFRPYAKEQLFDILRYRALEAFREGAISDEIIEYISDITAEYANSDVRYALDILLFSGMIAESEGAQRVNMDHVRYAISQTTPAITTEDLMNLRDREKLVLLAVAISLKFSKTPHVNIEEIWSTLQLILEERGLRPISRRKFIEELQSLADKGIIDIQGVTRIGISMGPLDKLQRFLDNLVRRIENTAI